MVLKRRFSERASRFLSIAAPLSADPMPALRADLPPPLFPPRSGLVHHVNGRPYAQLLERAVSVSPRIDWRWPPGEKDVSLGRLTLHYHEWLEGLDDDELRHAVTDWIEQNPPYAPLYWCWNWNSFALSIRVVVWMQQIAARGLQAQLARSLVAQLRFLNANLELDIGGNHIVRNAKALLWAARSFEGPEAAAWGARGAGLVVPAILPQILPD